eukprot:Awhi_evm2s13106
MHRIGSNQNEILDRLIVSRVYVYAPFDFLKKAEFVDFPGTYNDDAVDAKLQKQVLSKTDLIFALNCKAEITACVMEALKKFYVPRVRNKEKVGLIVVATPEKEGVTYQ